MKSNFDKSNSYWVSLKKETNNEPIKTTSDKVNEKKSTDSFAAQNKLPGILFITTYPPKQCGIATYSQDLIKALNNKFGQSFVIDICPLVSGDEDLSYPEEIKYRLNSNLPIEFIGLAATINDDKDITMIVIQHEFGLFRNCEISFLKFLTDITKPVILVYHTVIPNPENPLKEKVQQISDSCQSIIVMTRTSASILADQYNINPKKITVIPHGTHLVPGADKELLKKKYNLVGKKVLSTFGLLGPGKSIETTLYALPAIVKNNPDIVFLIIGKTHPTLIAQEGEAYRNKLKAIVEKSNLHAHVQFINTFLPLPDLLEYLQLTDIYLFTSKDPNQAVSGTFSYAISCGCPVISTPIPHAREVIKNDAGIIIDFENSDQLARAVLTLLKDEALRGKMSSNGLHRMASTAWENAAIAHAMLFQKNSDQQITLQYTLPVINLGHIKKMTTEFGIIQFSKINQPDISSGYTLDDNARALIAFCQHFELTGNGEDIKYISCYLHFIEYCQQPGGNFLNYVNEEKQFTLQNNSTNLSDSNGRAVWALGYLLSISPLLPKELETCAASVLQKALLDIDKIHSTRAMAFIIKGLYYHNKITDSARDQLLIRQLASRLVQMYRHEADKEWQWFESYLTYANSILPEALLCAWLATGDIIYKEIAGSAFDFLLQKTFKENNIKVISNKGWLHKAKLAEPVLPGGEQPIDVAYTILGLNTFYEVFKKEAYRLKMRSAFNWFLGNNHLHQVIYNPCTGGCYDGLEENNVNLNQGAESTISYLMARLTIEKSYGIEQRTQITRKEYWNLNKEKIY